MEKICVVDMGVTMNGIKPVQWSPDWYQLTSTDELITVFEQIKSLLHTRTGKSAAIWRNRLRRLEEELRRREETQQDMMEEEIQ
jgi:hypothetical protein